MNGILLLNKPPGITSNFIIKQLNNFYLKHKIGCCGKLDIIASGLLPICFNKFNKFNKYINNLNKQYITIIKLGFRTETSDTNGKFISSTIKLFYIKKNNILYNMYKIHGSSYQKPHIFSSVKYKGKNLYEYTRFGIKLKKKKNIYI